MIKWKSEKDGQKILGLALELGNIERLMEGMPIYIKGSDIGESTDIFIHYGLTADKIILQMKESGIVLPPEKLWKTLSKGEDQ